MNDRLTEISRILEDQQAEVMGLDGNVVILGIDTTARAIMALDGWRPIATAPKDGSWIIALSRDGGHVERVSWGTRRMGGEAWLSAERMVAYDLSGAWCGWMPCPDRPTPEPQP